MTRTIILAKAPVPGRVKTRLIPALGAMGAAEVAREMLGRTLEIALSAGLGDVELCMDPAPGDPDWMGFALPSGLSVSPQGEGDLGARMARAVQRRIEAGPVVLIGTDCVDMSVSLLAEAAKALQDFDAVINPCVDGGYALLGLRRFDASLFEGVAWSTSSVFDQTRAAMDALGWRVRVGQVVRDVDTPADLALWHGRQSLTGA